MTIAQRKAIANIIKAAEDSEYAITRQNSPEENEVIATFLKNLFKMENGEVKDFNEEVVNDYAGLQRSPKIKLL